MDCFRLNAVLTVDNGFDEPEESRYEWIYAVNLIEINEEVAIRRDRDLGINFLKESAVQYLFEVETMDVNLSLAPDLKKSEDFTRRLLYRYDWIPVGVEATGRIVSIGKSEEMTKSWEELKKTIQEDYKETNIKRRLEEIDREFADKSAFRYAIKQYQHFGLLFPQIPRKHDTAWTRQREIEISEYGKESFEEELIYTGTDGNIRNYNLTGKVLHVTRMELQEFTGEIKAPENELLPIHADLRFSAMTGKIKIKWNIELNKTTE